MDDCKPVLNTGLRGITIASTKISDVDGAAGKLVYRGYLAKDLAGKITFEELVYLLLFESLPSEDKLGTFNALLVAERQIPPELIAALETRPKDSLPMDILQAAAAMLAHHDPDTKEYTKEAALRIAIKLVAKFPTIVAAWDRIRNGKEPISPRTDLGHAANFLYMLNGKVPDDDLAGYFDVCLVLHAEHSFNASTFAAREVASTRAHMYSAIAAGVGSLSGALHGGANQRVMEMLLTIGSVDKVEEYLNDVLESGGVICNNGTRTRCLPDRRSQGTYSRSHVQSYGRTHKRYTLVRSVCPARKKGKRGFQTEKRQGYLRECGFLQRFPLLLYGNFRGSFHAVVRYLQGFRLVSTCNRRTIRRSCRKTGSISSRVRICG